MTSDKPSATNPAARIDEFLGRATSFMAIYGASDPARLSQLAIIADQLGLTNQEYQSAMLRLREHQEITPAPRAKTLPRTLPPDSDGSEAAAPQSPPPKPTKSSSKSPAKPPVGDDDTPSRCVLTASDPLRESFQQQAKLLLANANAETPAKLRKLAAKLGVDDDQFERWLEQITGPLVIAEIVPPDDEEEEEPKEPSPPKIARKAPQEMYDDYLELALGAITSKRINERRETKLIAEGVEKLGLSPVLARDMLYAAAERRGFVLLSRQKPEEPPPPPVDQQREQTITEFQQRAASIIAGQGGVSSVCRAMIAEAAAEFGLSKEEKEQALVALQRQADTQLSDPLEERIAAFRRFAATKLKNTESQIVGDLLTKQLIQIGIDLHGLPEETAAATVRESIASSGLRVVTLEQAVAHVLSIVDDLLADEGFISIENRKRLLAEGRQWGVAQAEAGQLIEEHIANIEVRAKRRRRRIFAAVMMAILALFSGLAAIYWSKPEWANFGQGSGVWSVDVAARNGTDDPDGQTDPEGFHRVSWWNEALTIDMLTLRRRRNDLQEPTEAIAKEDPKARAEGYATFIPKLVSTLAEERDATHAEQLRVILRRLAIDEPDEAAFTALAKALLKEVPAKGDAVSASSNFGQSYVALGLLVDVAQQRELAVVRREEIVQNLEQRLGVVTIPSADLATVFADELARNQYGSLRQLAEKDPAAAMTAHRVLQRVVQANVNRALANNLDGDALLAILPLAPQDLNLYRGVLDEQISQRNLAVLLRLIELLESGKTSGQVARELQFLLARTINVKVDGMDATDAAIVMRGALAGLAGQGDVGEMSRFFVGQAHQIDLNESEFGSPDEWLNDAVDLSRVSALGAAAAQKESGRRLFQSLSSDVPEPIRASKPTVRRAPTQDRLDRIREAFRQLSRANDPRRRVMAYDNLAAIVAGSDDLDYYHAERLVDYLLTKKLADEHEAIVRRISDFRQSSMLRLALSDHLDETVMPLSELQRLAGEVVGRPVILNDKLTWKEDLRRILLSDALPRLQAEKNAAGEDVSGDVLEQAAAGLLDYYRIQAEIAGVPYEQRMALRTPSEALEALIQIETDQLAAAKLPPELQAQLDDVTLRARVVSLVAHNDLAKTVALQRIWLELSAIAAVKAQPNSRLATDQLIGRLRQVDRGSHNIFQQLRNGEAALVRMQMIRMEA
ncbi:hypothetical protein [Blastopirellula marina]|uniref:Uncharacterized protein n=1 Tax=Blastopirellula marina TaxID=124 RepID=A0A2S8GF40_9BACT|nr:hypothetical protein [Blastopirellula marina]PQO43049.1 hypothetical protein C5Y93_25370 [Blastopirellula marina]